MKEKTFAIAVDGYASSGKSTLARDLAQSLGFTFVDSGAMYRAVTLFFIRHTVSPANLIKVQEALNQIHIHFNRNDQRNETWMNGRNVDEEIRSMEVNRLVSEVSAIPIVRKKLVEEQKALGQQQDVVMDGRDIGTVVFPDAGMKIFVTASVAVRAERRLKELRLKGDQVTTADEVKKNLVERDLADSSREHGPLAKAHDAIEIDNSNLTREEQLEWALAEWSRVRLKLER